MFARVSDSPVNTFFVCLQFYTQITNLWHNITVQELIVSCFHSILSFTPDSVHNLDPTQQLLYNIYAYTA